MREFYNAFRLLGGTEVMNKATLANFVRINEWQASGFPAFTKTIVKYDKHHIRPEGQFKKKFCAISFDNAFTDDLAVGDDYGRLFGIIGKKVNENRLG